MNVSEVVPKLETIFGTYIKLINAVDVNDPKGKRMY